MCEAYNGISENMPYSLPDYAVMQAFAQNLKIFFEQKRRYNPLPYVQLRQQVYTLRADYVSLAMEKQLSLTAQVAEVILPAKRLRQIACIQQVCKDLPSEEQQQSPIGASNNTILLASVIYRYLRLKNEYNRTILPGASFFARVAYYARTATAIVVDRSVESNCKLFNLLQKIIHHSSHNRLDSLTIKNCLEVYCHFIKSMLTERLADYEDIVQYEHEGKEGYLRNIQQMIDDYQIGAQILETELIHIVFLQSIAKALCQWDKLWIQCIEQNAKDLLSLTLETLPDWLNSKIHDKNFLCYLDKIINFQRHSLLEHVQSEGLKDALCALWNMNKQYALLGAYHFIYQSIEQREKNLHTDESHQPFLDLFNSITLGPVDRKNAESLEEYWNDSKYSYQALDIFFSVSQIGEVFNEDGLSYWGGLGLLRKKIIAYKEMKHDEEFGFVLVTSTA